MRLRSLPWLKLNERTGVEMEALCGLNIALLTIWDLVKTDQCGTGDQRCQVIVQIRWEKR